MKTLPFSVVTFFALFSLMAFAQKASITDIPTDEETTISISKGSKSTSTSETDLDEGESEIEGEPNVMQDAAKASWKKACADWKKEKREDNKGSKILSLECNKSTCAKNEHFQYTCSSVGTYKIRSKK